MTHLSTDTCLNLVMPRGLEEAVSDLLLAHPELRASFTACRVEAHGDGVELRSASEHVRGHADPDANGTAALAARRRPDARLPAPKPAQSGDFLLDHPHPDCGKTGMKSHHRLKFVWLLATLPQTIALAAQTTTSTRAEHRRGPSRTATAGNRAPHPAKPPRHPHQGCTATRQEAEGRRLQAGPHEWNLGLTRQQRRIQTPDPVTGATRYNEWDASLQRGIRLPGKAQTDEALAHAGIEALHWSRGETLHETSRKLLTDWFSGLREEASARAWAEQAALLDKQAQQLNRRRELGDASRLEALQATAAAAQARSQARMSRSRANAAAIELQQRYPGLTLPDVLPETTPQALTDPPEGSGWMASSNRITSWARRAPKPAGAVTRPPRRSGTPARPDTRPDDGPRT